MKGSALTDLNYSYGLWESFRESSGKLWLKRYFTGLRKSHRELYLCKYTNAVENGKFETGKLVEIRVNQGLSQGGHHHPHCLCTRRQYGETVATQFEQSLSNTSDHLRYRCVCSLTNCNSKVRRWPPANIACIKCKLCGLQF